MSTHRTKKVAKKLGGSMQRKSPLLLFIDTNVLLDFYRARNDAGISLLSKIDSLHDKIITTCQVEMEFKKNRQKVISESVTALKVPDLNIPTPAFLNESAAVRVIKTRNADMKDRVKAIQERVLAALEKPTSHDKIYQSVQRLFTNGNTFNLRRDGPEYKSTWRSALRRFLEGQPPRKNEDTSAGDAINWEWIVRCAKTAKADVVLVSRDADYGLILKDKGYANNWLSEEFKKRVGKQRRLILVARLSEALKLVDVKVTAAEVASERVTIAKSPRRTANYTKLEEATDAAVYQLIDTDEVNSAIAETNATGWEVSTYELQNVKKENGVISGDLQFWLSGDQDEDKSWFGNSIVGCCTVELDSDGNLEFNEIGASVDRDDDPDLYDAVADDDDSDNSAL
jgi:hypothetical protein